MSYDRKKFIAGLGTLVFGSFLITVFSLPRPTGIIISHGAIDRFIKMRTDWSIAWTVLFGGLIVSIAIVLIVEAFVAKDE